MCLRVLGYTDEVEARGTWPTNYISKAQQLDLLRDIVDESNKNSFSYNDKATRGDIAILVWNMLRTKMWVVIGKTEGDGLMTYPDTDMIKVMFSDYVYSEEEVFKSWSYNADEEKVYVELADAGELVYDKNDFYTFVPGTKVSTLYRKDKKENVLLSVVPNDDNTLVDGSVSDLEKDYTKYTAADEATYAYLLLSAKKKSADVEGKVELNGADSEYVTKVESKTNYTKVKTTAKTRSIYEDDEAKTLVIYGNERLSLADLKAGDVITWISKDSSNEGVAVLSRETVSGTFESLTYEETEEDTRDFVELDNKEYDVVKGILTIAKVNENDEETFDDVDFNAVTLKKNDYIGEEATLYINFLGEVVRMEFGVVNASDVKGDFFMAPTGSIWSVADEDGATWYIKLANEDGEESYVFADGKEDTVTFEAGKCYWVEFNDDDEIKAATVITSDKLTLKDFTMANITAAVDKDTKYVNNDKYRVVDSTKVFTVRPVEDENGEPRNDKFELTVTEGYKELEGISTGMLAIKKDTNKVSYAFVEGDSTSEDKDYGIVKAISIVEEKCYITIKGEDGKKDEKYEAVGNVENRPERGSIIAYTIDSKNRIKVAFEYKLSELLDAGRVTNVDDGTYVTYVFEGKECSGDLGLVSNSKAYEDYRVFNIEVSYDKDSNPIFDSIKEIEPKDINVKKDCGLAIRSKKGQEFIAIIYDIEWPEEEKTTKVPSEEPSEEPSQELVENSSGEQID